MTYEEQRAKYQLAAETAKTLVDATIACGLDNREGSSHLFEVEIETTENSWKVFDCQDEDENAESGWEIRDSDGDLVPLQANTLEEVLLKGIAAGWLPAQPRPS